MPAKKLIPPREQLLNKTGREIAKEFNVCQKTAYTWLYILDIPIANHAYGKKFIPAKGEIEHLSYKQLCAKYNISINTAIKWRKKYDIYCNRKRSKKLIIAQTKMNEKQKTRLNKVIKCLPILSDSEIARAIRLSRERVGQIRASINDCSRLSANDRAKIENLDFSNIQKEIKNDTN
jgi:transposase